MRRKMPDRSSNYSISRIRLVNWHNFLDETIELTEGGHLFLLGDNASGKTTVLDAVHYVLTAGENLEFNSAARVAGARLEGRRAQGVVMRYNSEAGALNPEGGITYAAVEIIGRNGKRSTYAVGLEVHAMNEQIRRWGIVRECPLEEIPLVVERDGRKYPAERRDIRSHFDSGSGYYTNIESYKREVAKRLFGSEPSFYEITRLLSMGKAYREIVTHAGDYHELFKRLLPEPRTDIFERIITALNSLEQSAGDLKRLQEQHDFARQLADHVDRIDTLREEAIRLKWLRGKLELEENRAAIERNEENAAKIRRERAEIEAKLTALHRDMEALERQIADLQSKDSSGLVRQEKELTRDEKGLMTGRADARDKAKQMRLAMETAAKEQQKQREELADAVRKLFAETSRIAPKLPVPVSDFLSALDQAFRLDAPEEGIERVPFAPTIRTIQGELSRTDLAIGRLTARQETLAARINELDAECCVLRKQVGLAPDLPGFKTALKSLKDGMFAVMPLYEGLEWQTGIPEKQKAFVEEIIGIDILATFIIQGDEAQREKASRQVFPVAPGLRLAIPPEHVSLPPWIRDSFDISKSDPDALRVLAAEMLTDIGPEVTNADVPILRFRAHQRRLGGQPACFVGAHTRKEALSRQIREQEKQLAEANAQCRELEREQKKLAGQAELLRQASDVLSLGEKQLQQSAARIHQAIIKADNARRIAESAEDAAADADYRLAACRERLELLRLQIREEGLDTFEKRLQAAQRKRDKISAEADVLNQSLGAKDNMIKGLDDQHRKFQKLTGEIQEGIEAAAGQLRHLLPEVEDLANYILETCGGEEFKSLHQVTAAEDMRSRTEASQSTSIQVRIRDERFAAVFGFHYDPEQNALLDRRQRAVAILADDMRRQVEEQREIISEKNRELFRKLVVGELLGHLQGKVQILERMVRDINEELKKRSFGSTRYRFQLKTVDRFKHLVKLVRSYNPWKAEEGENEIRQFFEDQREAITSTEVGVVPDLLDYRNWFHYDMIANSTGGEGIVMDRMTKAVGSGGEQAVPNYLLFLTVAHFMFKGNEVPLHTLLFDEAFYGIDNGRRDQILGFASDLNLQLFVASPDQDGVRQEVPNSTTILVVKDQEHLVHLYPFNWINPQFHHRDIFAESQSDGTVEFGEEI